MKKVLLIGFLCTAFGASLHADAVTDLLQKASDYEDKLSVQYDVSESYERDNNAPVKSTYSVLKKGKKELIQDSDGKVRLKNADKETKIEQDKPITKPVMPSIIDLLLADYQSGSIKAKVSSGNNSTILLKGKKDSLTFKATFSSSPVVLLDFECKDKNDHIVSEGKFDYDFSTDPVTVVKVTYSGDSLEKGKSTTTYKKTIKFSGYAKDEDLTDDQFAEDSVKNQKFDRKSDKQKNRGDN